MWACARSRCSSGWRPGRFSGLRGKSWLQRLETRPRASIDRLVHYAGWSDKFTQILGSANPVAAPYFNFTIPEPTGVVGVVAPETSSLLGLDLGSDSIKAVESRADCMAVRVELARL